MIDYLFYVTSLLVFSFIIFNSLFWLSLFQSKDYRIDRLLIHLRETSQGKELLWGKIHIIKIILFILYFISIFYLNIFIIYPFAIFCVYLYSFIKNYQNLLQKKIVFPNFTFKIIIICVGIFLVELGIFLLPLFDKFFWLLFMDTITPLIVLLFIFVFSIPTDFYRDEIINRAIRKINRQNNLVSIGVVGSYGKTSTKNFMYDVLSYKYNVFKTDNNNNTAIGIARSILKKLSQKKQIAVIEMEAYKKKEIGDMCEMVHPSIGVITGISDNHISLFKNITNIMNAQYELIESLPRNGIAIFNGNSKNALTLYKKTKRKKILFTTDEKMHQNADIYSVGIKQKKFSLSFEVVLNGKSIGFFKSKLLGARTVERLLPAIYIGKHFNIKTEDIKKIVEGIKPLHNVMEPFISIKGAVLINDTHYSNSGIVLDSVEYMECYKGKKIMVLEPFSERGNNVVTDHYELGRELGKKCDFVFLTNNNSFRHLLKGINSVKSKCRIKVASPLEIATYVDGMCGKNDVVVFEGKEAIHSFSLISSDPVY